jgi:hypothetical protein
VRDFSEVKMKDVFDTLKALIEPHAQFLDVKCDEPAEFYLDTFHVMKNKRPLFFAAVQAKKNYVSYHLMPVYLNPTLLNGVSPELKKRMQGKACFNFKAVDKILFRELAKLTKAGLLDYRKAGYLKRPEV